MRLKNAMLIVVSTACSVDIGFATNILTSDDSHWWWWLALGIGSLGLVICGIFSLRESSRLVMTPSFKSRFTKVNIKARDNSVAAYKINKVSMPGAQDK
ncbi:hypothetical protein BN1047_01043 [Mycolicibacterium neoaurum]|uniref:Transmembrane protein n=1 Tax=Mycolicibacterium neoaurum TaxID=1795 RepID=A0AAV2WG91_MYCNE|nr:hypothetical protein BN1047_01043 [Mycolicibacterium neoaurum]